MKFSEFADNTRPLEGRKIKINDILGKTIIVVGYSVKESRYQKGCGKYLTLQIEYESEKAIVFTGSAVLIEQIEKYGDRIPFEAVVIQIEKFYTFT